MTGSLDKYQQFLKSIQAGDIKSNYVFYGEEDFLIEACINQLKKKVLNPDTLDLDCVVINAKTDPGALNIDALMNTVYNPPFMSKKRVFILKYTGIFSAFDSKKEWVELFKRHSDVSVLIFWEEKLDKRGKKWIQVIEETGSLIDMPSLKENELLFWIDGYLKKHGLTMGRSEKQSLMNRADDKLRLLSNELKKIVLYAQSQKITNIGMDVLESLCPPDLNGRIFDLTDALSSGNKARAWTLYYTLLEQSKQKDSLVSGMGTLFMLSRHIKHLIIAKSFTSTSEVQQKVKLQPFVVRQLQTQCKNYPMERLVELFNLCYRTRVMLTSGAMPEDLAMHILIAHFNS